MIRSMTGFGGASSEANGAYYSVEVRSVNNRYLKTQVRIPEELQELEPELEATVNKRFSRGSVVATVKWVDRSADSTAQINGEALRGYVQQLKDIPALKAAGVQVDLASLLQLPGVVVAAPGEARLSAARDILEPLFTDACDKVVAMREREGEALLADLRTHIESIREHLQVVMERAPEVVSLYQERLRQRMASLLAQSDMAVRDEDLLREVAVFAERADIAEEISRLNGHLEQFESIVSPKATKPVGRTLDFLSQEMLREANTIGSKCLDVEIARRTVEIKGAIDRIKEQAQNVE